MSVCVCVCVSVHRCPMRCQHCLCVCVCVPVHRCPMRCQHCLCVCVCVRVCVGAQVSYEVSVDVDGSVIQWCSCCSERNVCLSVIEPVTVSFELYSCQVCMHLTGRHACVKLLIAVSSGNPPCHDGLPCICAV